MAELSIVSLEDNKITTANFGWTRVLGAALLVSGTCIGAGMISLPVATAAGGFYPTIGLFVLVWALMAFSALVMLEVSLWLPGETNLISMARATLGKPGEIVAWATYIFFLYCLMAAYTSSGSALLHQGLMHINGIFAKQTSSTLAYTGFFAVIVFFGARWVDFVNRFLIAGLVAAYLVLITTVTPHIDLAKLEAHNAKFLFAAIPLMVTSFGFHLLVPTLKSYLREDAVKLRCAILIGSLIPFAVYIVWEFVILGIVPTFAKGGLVAMLSSGEPVVPLTKALDHLAQSKWISIGARFFSFFAVVSSFIGVALGLFDFFADGLHIKKTFAGKIMLAGLTFVPPLIFAMFYPQGFILALGYAGIFAAILLIIYPAAMALAGRNTSLAAGHYKVAGGKLALWAAIIVAVVVIALEILEQLQMLPFPNIS